MASNDRRIHLAAEVVAGDHRLIYVLTRCGIDLGMAWGFSHRSATCQHCLEEQDDV